MISVGGKHDSIKSTGFDRYPKPLLELQLQEGSLKWVTKKEKMKYAREGHIALAIPPSVRTTCRANKIGWNEDVVAKITAGMSERSKQKSGRRRRSNRSFLYNYF